MGERRYCGAVGIDVMIVCWLFEDGIDFGYSEMMVESFDGVTKSLIRSYHCCREVIILTEQFD